MLRRLMILAGAIFILGALIAGGYVISLGCHTPEAAGCQDNLIDSIAALMIADSGILFWLAWVIGIFLVWGGMRIRG